METGLEGKVALVTGASKGIGLAIARALAAEGVQVMLSSRKEDALRAAVDGDAGAAFVVANAREPSDAHAAVAATMDRFGALDILVNNAATNPYIGRTVEIDLPRYNKTHQVHLRGPLVWTQAAWGAWMEANGGVVINIASVGGVTYGGQLGIYDNTKAALIHLTVHLAVELAPSVRVNRVAPGLVKTDFARALWEPNEQDVSESRPLRRIGMPQDIADAVVFLASDRSSWMTGQRLVVDGGATLARTSA